MRRTVSVRFFLSLASLFCAAMFAEAQRRVVEPVHRDYATPPASASEMADAADAVVVARYTGKTRIVVDDLQNSRSYFSTDYTFEILEVIKSHFLLGNVSDEFAINLTGGVRDVGDARVERVVPDTNPLRTGATYVVFLKWNSVRNGLYVGWQQSGIFEITTRGIQVIDRTRPHHDGQTREAFVAEIRR